LILDDSTDEARVERLTALADRIRAQIGVATVRFALTGSEAGRAVANLCDAMIVGLGVPVIAIGRYGARDAERLDCSEIVLLVDGERGPAEQQCAAIAELFGRIANGSWATGSPLLFSSRALCELSLDDRGLATRLRFASARSVPDRDQNQPTMLMDIQRQLAHTNGLDEALVQLVGARHAAVHRAGVDAEALMAHPRGTPGGLDDIDLLTRVIQFRGARRFPELYGQSTAAALDQFQTLELLPAHTARELRRAHFHLRAIESYREFALGDESLCDSESQEIVKALAIAVGATDRGELERLLHGAGDAVTAALIQSSWG
jgi:glutamine synthetase adenylyltransferase